MILSKSFRQRTDFRGKRALSLLQLKLANFLEHLEVFYFLFLKFTPFVHVIPPVMLRLRRLFLRFRLNSGAHWFCLLIA